LKKTTSNQKNVVFLIVVDSVFINNYLSERMCIAPIKKKYLADLFFYKPMRILFLYFARFKRKCLRRWCRRPQKKIGKRKKFGRI